MCTLQHKDIQTVSNTTGCFRLKSLSCLFTPHTLTGCFPGRRPPAGMEPLTIKEVTTGYGYVQFDQAGVAPVEEQRTRCERSFQL